MRSLIGWLAIVLTGNASAQLSLQLTPQSLPVRPNLVRNGSFEQAQNGLPFGWQWDKRNTDATVQLVEGEAATGTRCLKFTSATPFAPDTYGLLRYEGGVPVKPNTVYTLSVRYKARGGYQGFVGGGKNRRVRLPLEDTNGQWKRAAVTFATLNDETLFDLIIAIEAPTSGLYIDDLKLEEGREPSFFLPAEAPDRPLLSLSELPDQIYLNEPWWHGTIEFYLPVPIREARIEAQLGEQRVQQQANLPAGVIRAEFQFAEPPARKQTLHIRIETPELPAVEASRSLTFFTRREAQQRLETLRQSLRHWQAQLDAIRQRGQDIAYPMVSFTVLQESILAVQSDLQNGQLQRAFQQLDEMERIHERLAQTLNDAIRGKRRLPTVPRYVTSPVQVKGASLIADTVDPLTNRRERRPVFLAGPALGSAADETTLAKLRRMGFNLVQVEIGVSDILPRNEEVNLRKLEKELLPLLRRATQQNMRVDLLLTPEALSDRVQQEYPELRQNREGFLQALKESVRRSAPRLRNQPALNSICLSPEMSVLDAQTPPLLAAWHKWLQTRHSTLLTLNTRWLTNYSQWEQIPIPTENLASEDDEENHASGAPFAEFCEFYQEWTAGWHRQLAEEVKRTLPGVPIHAKLSSQLFLSDREQQRGIDPELFASFCELNGNNTRTPYHYAPEYPSEAAKKIAFAPFAFDWVHPMMAHDLQRSLRNAPVFNSERFSPWGSSETGETSAEHPVPPEYGRALLWEKAIRGLSAAIFWVAERPDKGTTSPSLEELRHRPALLERLGHTMLDLNRLAPYIAALQNQPPDLYLYHSPLDLVLQGADAVVTRDNLYIALTMLGVRVGFVTERQAAARQLPAGTKRIVLPAVQYISDEALLALDAYRQRGGGLAALGEPILRFDRYGRPRSSRLPVQTIDRDATLDARLLLSKLARFLDEWGIARPLRLLNETGQPAWGIAYRTAPYGHGFVASLCNYTQQPITVRLINDKNQPIRAVNLLTGERMAEQITLQPLEPVLLQW